MCGTLSGVHLTTLAVRGGPWRHESTTGVKISWDTLSEGAFLTFYRLQKEKLSFPSSIPSMQCCAAFQPVENNKHPNFEWRGDGSGVDCFVLWSSPIRLQCLNNFVADCGSLRKSTVLRHKRKWETSRSLILLYSKSPRLRTWIFPS